MKTLPSHLNSKNQIIYGTPDYIKNNVGKCIDANTLINIFESNTNVSGSVTLSCDENCYLQELNTCYGTKIDNKTGARLVGIPIVCTYVPTSCSSCSSIKLYDYKSKNIDGTCTEVT
eukprot:Pgem_evm1s13526